MVQPKKTPDLDNWDPEEPVPDEVCRALWIDERERRKQPEPIDQPDSQPEPATPQPSGVPSGATDAVEAALVGTPRPDPREASVEPPTPTKAEPVEAGPSFDELPDPDEPIDSAEPWPEPWMDELEQGMPPTPIGAPEPGPKSLPVPPSAEPRHSGDTAASPSIPERGPVQPDAGVGQLSKPSTRSEGDAGQVEEQRTGEQQQVGGGDPLNAPSAPSAAPSAPQPVMAASGLAVTPVAPEAAAALLAAAPTAPAPIPLALTPQTLALTVQPIEETLRAPSAKREPCVEGLCDRGDIVILAARPNTGKTPLIMQLGISLAAGRRVLGLATNRCHVGIIDLETPWDKSQEILKRQSSALQISLDEIGSSLDLLVRGNPDDRNSRILEYVCSKMNAVECMEWLQDLVSARQYGALIIDPILDLFQYASKDEEKIRRLLGDLSQIRYRPPYPLIGLTVHLRKPDRRNQPSPLATDPHGWWDEVLGTVVWATGSDVRLGLERMKDGTQVVFSGYRRGYDALRPMIIEPAVRDIDGRPQPTMWVRRSDEEVARVVLTDSHQVAFFKIPRGPSLGWKDLGETTGLNKSSLSRFIDQAAGAGLLEIEQRAGAAVYTRPGPANDDKS